MSIRLPGSLLSDDHIDPLYLYDDPNTQFYRDAELRQAATRAWAALDNRKRVRRALSARPAKQETFTEGELIFVWRQPKVGTGRWVGPGVVILPTSGGAWVNMRGSLWRVANCQMRSATREESMGAELVNRYLADMKADLLKTRGARKFVDVAAEGDPRFPTGDEEQDEDDEARRLADVDDELPAQDNEADAAEPEPVDAQSNASSTTQSRRVSRRQRRQDTAASRDTSRDSSQVSEPQRERGPSLQIGNERTTSELASGSRPARSPPFPFPFDQHQSSQHQP